MRLFVVGVNGDGVNVDGVNGGNLASVKTGNRLLSHQNYNTF